MNTPQVDVCHPEAQCPTGEGHAQPCSQALRTPSKACRENQPRGPRAGPDAVVTAYQSQRSVALTVMDTLFRREKNEKNVHFWLGPEIRQFVLSEWRPHFPHSSTEEQRETIFPC